MLVFAIIRVSVLRVATTSGCEVTVEKAVSTIFCQTGITIVFCEVFSGKHKIYKN
jgi:hypothetical protein